MSLLANTQRIIGLMEEDSFYCLQHIGNGEYYHLWCCDSFTVIYVMDRNKRLQINVTFKTLTGEKTFEWDLQSLLYLSRPNQLKEVLLNHGVRVSTHPQSLISILSAIQHLDLVYNNIKDKKYEH